MSAALIMPLILVAGALQAWGPPMNGALRNALVNPWLASLVSFLPVIALLSVVLLCRPTPVPSAGALAQMPWWAPLGGLMGAVAVIAGLMFVDRIGAGALAGLTITANLLMSLLIDQFGWFNIPVHTLNLGRIAGAVLMTAGIALIAWF